mmetsp:Transcript_56465/g.163767  ORF Transcript_56465/g.163767 Transcript_56465/m.163767 type:complete len:299 (-) Transcript_56465:1781-2677(-)
MLEVKDEGHLTQHLAHIPGLGHPCPQGVDDADAAAVEDHQLVRRLAYVRELRVLRDRDDLATSAKLDEEALRAMGKDLRLEEVVQEEPPGHALLQRVRQGGDGHIHALTLDELARLLCARSHFGDKRMREVGVLYVLIDDLAHGFPFDGSLVARDHLVHQDAVAISVHRYVQEEHGANPPQLDPRRREDVTGRRLAGDPAGAPIETDEVLPPERGGAAAVTERWFTRTVGICVHPTPPVGLEGLLVVGVGLVVDDEIVVPSPARAQHPPNASQEVHHSEDDRDHLHRGTEETLRSLCR